MMQKNEEKKCQERKHSTIEKLEKKLKKEVDIPRLTSDYLDQTLQIA